MPAPESGTIRTSDGIELSYDVFHAGAERTVVLIHGWSGSRLYWKLNAEPISTGCRVIAYDQRHHGASDKPSFGFHVARLAADLRDLLEQLDVRDAWYVPCLIILVLLLLLRLVLLRLVCLETLCPRRTL
jgi:non-heme chloroperoxidase